ncbi:MAG TPA: EF-hand domain-containing protein [Casimicrobiaceae bacterium]|nr:EF-hand domain-containing protein [Casimicrobiaceae bacterium]
MSRPHRFRLAPLAAVLASLASLLSAPVAVADESPPAAAQRPLRDPWLPPDARNPSTAPPTQGAALREQVERKLKRDFDAADVSGTGTLTRAQASAAGLGYIARHFDQIDRNKSGVVRFDDVKRYLRERGAQLD